MTKLAAKVQIKRECHGCNCVGIDLGCQYMNQNVKICESDEDRMRSLAIEKISVTIDQILEKRVSKTLLLTGRRPLCAPEKVK